MRPLLVIAAIAIAFARAAEASCGAPANAIEAENCLPGTPPGVWDVVGAGSPSIQGFATEISVNVGDTVDFKVSTPASAFTVEIYRLGYYQGNGARLVDVVTPSASLPQSQPTCLTDGTGLIDCGNWAISASWAVPGSATSGLYLARFVRTDTGGASHAPFVVRDDASTSDLLFQTSDPTWQAYNDYGGNSLYVGNPPVGRAYKVSYNRPFTTRAVFGGNSWIMNAEYPMIRWLESNGYDVSYTSGVDTDRSGGLLANHRVFLSNGHDEYWSAAQRANVETALVGGLHLAFFTGNTMFWKTRWETSIDGSGTPYRTLVCYKETHAGTPIDPLDPPTWTGTWRDARFSPPGDGGRPENELLGTLFRVNGIFVDRMTVPYADGRMRFWRNTSVANLTPGGAANLAPGTLGEEVDLDEDNGFRPPGLVRLSTKPILTNTLWLLDNGSTYGAGEGAHHLTLYRHASGGLVFSAGSFQWAWGLDANHDRPWLGSSTDVRMQQATVNLLADMDAQPATLRPGLIPATASSDTTPPVPQLSFPGIGASTEVGAAVQVSGSAYDDDGRVGGIEVSIDGGFSWHPAVGRESWSYTFVPSAPGTATIRVRAADDSGNLSAPTAPRALTIGPCTRSCTLYTPAARPAIADGGPDLPVELGLRFQSDTAGYVSGIRFYKHVANVGPHVVNLWTDTGVLLASRVVTGETASGWQQMDFPAPVPVAANTRYVASYFVPSGHYSVDLLAFSGQSVARAPLLAPAAGPGEPNGVYAYAPSSTFPTQTFQSSHYWVDVVWGASATTTLTSISISPPSAIQYAGTQAQYAAVGHYSDASTLDLSARAILESGNPAVARLSGTGLLSAVAAGSTTVTARFGATTASTPVSVADAPPPGECADGTDNDGDGLADYPADPGCANWQATSKEAPQCQDGLDNDSDTQVDHPGDLQCSSPSDDDEATNPGSSCGLLGLEPLALWLLRCARRRRG